jgi:mono/diheme cytochrome c family protein/cytochrome bd-type quinol oxidase subunit 1
MNFPVWELELGGGFLVAAIATTHVFVAHFAVGGGLLLVITEQRARRDGDEAMLGWLRRHSKFFALLTLVFGAITGVGIWFAIGLVHPSATSALVRIFVWAWAVEWVFFAVEIVAAIVYYQTWDRTDRRTHLTIGWIYFVAAYMSLVVINGILAFMLTPGDWLQSGDLWDAFFNPTYLPQLVLRTLAAIAFAGLYIFVTAWREERALRARLARYAATWALPATLAGPLAAWYYFHAAGPLTWEAVRVAVPKAVAGSTMTAGGAVLYTVLLLTVALVARKRPGIVSLPVGVLLLMFGYTSLAGAELIRENLRKPYVIGTPETGGYMYVNAVRTGELEAVRARGVLASSKWLVSDGRPALADDHEGGNLFRIACRACHTVNGYNAVAPLVAGISVAALQATVRTLDKRRGRMPPFPGNDAEADQLALYLAGLDGDVGRLPEPIAANDAVGRAKALLDEHCLSCHSLDDAQDDPPALLSRIEGWTAQEAYTNLGRLSELNEEMYDFEGTDAERHILANYLGELGGGGGSLPLSGGKGGGRERTPETETAGSGEDGGRDAKKRGTP